MHQIRHGRTNGGCTSLDGVAEKQQGDEIALDTLF